MITTLKDLWRFPKGIKLKFFDERVKFDRELYFVDVDSVVGQKEFWDGYEFHYEEDILPDEVFQNDDQYNSVRVILFPYTEENVKALYNALLAKQASMAIDDPYTMKEHLESNYESIKFIRQLVKEK